MEFHNKKEEDDKKEQKEQKEKNEKNIKSACKEYNTLKYKTMIMTGNNIDKTIENEKNEETINSFLLNELKEHKKQPWNKLTKTEKIKKINNYIENKLKIEHALSPSECKQTQKYMSSMIDRKKLAKNSDLEYNEETGVIDKIHVILFNIPLRKFTLNNDYKPTTKKKTKTIKKVKPDNKIENEVKP